MTCPEIETLLRWQDGALASPARSELETHLRSCSRCQALLAAEARLSASVIMESRPAAPASSHPDEFDLARLAEGLATPPERESIGSHVAACAPCRIALSDYVRDLRALTPQAAPARYVARGLSLSEDRETEGELRGLPSPSLASRVLGFFRPAPGRALSWLRPAGALAILLLAVTLLPRVLSGPGGPPDEGGYRPGDDPGALAIFAPAANAVRGADLAAGALLFEWTAWPGATAYRATIARPDGSILARERTAEPRWAPRVTDLSDEVEIRFRVEVLVGGETAVSAERTIRIE